MAVCTKVFRSGRLSSASLAAQPTSKARPDMDYIVGVALACAHCNHSSANCCTQHKQPASTAVKLTPFFAVEAFVDTDQKYLQADSGANRDDGCTAVTALLVGQKLIVANVGDSRAVLSKGGQGVLHTVTFQQTTVHAVSMHCCSKLPTWTLHNSAAFLSHRISSLVERDCMEQLSLATLAFQRSSTGL